MNQEPWEAFAAEALYDCPGASVKFADFYEEYQTHCTCKNIEPIKLKSLLQLIRNRGDKYTVGIGKNKTMYIANVSLNPKTVPDVPLKLNRKGRLVQCIE